METNTSIRPKVEKKPDDGQAAKQVCCLPYGMRNEQGKFTETHTQENKQKQESFGTLKCGDAFVGLLQVCPCLVAGCVATGFLHRGPVDAAKEITALPGPSKSETEI